METRNQITAKQLGMIILSAQVGAGVIILPSHLAKEVGPGGWISILGAGLLSTMVIVMMMALLRKYAGQSILEINRHLFGNFLGQTINLLLVLYLSFLMVAALRYFTEFIQLFTLEATPGCLVALLIIIPTVYLTWHGLKPVARFSYIMLFVLFAILLLGFLLWKKTRLTFLMPIGAADITVLSKSIAPTFLSFIGFELVVFLYPYVRDQENALKWVVASNLCTMFFFLITFLIAIGIFGENHLKMQIAPLFNLSRYYRVPFIGRVDLLFILIWFPFLESTFRSYFFTAYNSMRRLYPSLNQKFFFGCLLVLTILLSRLPKDFLQTTQMTNLVGFAGITVVGFFFFSYLYSFFKKKGQVRRALISLLIVGSLFLFSGCWDQRRIEKTGFMLQVGIELSPEQRLLVTSIYPAVDAKAQNQDEIITAEGDLVREARNRQEKTAAKIIDSGKLQQLLISKDLAALGIEEIIEILERDPLNAPISYVVIVDGSPKELLEKAQTFSSKPRPVLYLNQLLMNNINTAYTPDTKTHDFMIRYLAPGLDPITPLIKLETDGIRVLGSALFSGDKMVGALDTQQTAFLLAMMDQFKNTELFFAPITPQKADSVKKGLSLSNVRSRSKVRVKIENGRPVADIALAFTASLVEYRRDGLDQPPVQKEIEEHLAGQIKQACLEIIRYTQEIGSDPIGIGDLIRAKYPAYWQQVDWRAAYRETIIKLSVKLDLLKYGAIN